MEMFEKVERLREHADVSYEEAKEALEKCDGDLLDAMVYLEKQGKTHAPKKSVHSTNYDQQEEYIPVKTTIQKEKKVNTDSAWYKFKELLKKFWIFLISNSFVVSKDDNDYIKIPNLLLFILLIFFWWWMLAILVIMLIIGFRYSFRGRTNMDSVNDAMNKAGDAVNKVKDEIKNHN